MQQINELRKQKKGITSTPYLMATPASVSMLETLCCIKFTSLFAPLEAEDVKTPVNEEEEEEEVAIVAGLQFHTTSPNNIN